MALAYGFGHMGFGFGFINFIGTVLFFIFLVMVLKMAFKGRRFSDANGGPPWQNWRGFEEQHTQRETPKDEAMKVARERVANSEITPEEFETLKTGLRASAPQTGYRQDSAIATARMRFAKGEISQEAFDAVRKVLLD